MKRILTTHVGSLARPRDLLDQMKEKLAGKAPGGYDERVRRAVAECVRKQSETGIDIVTDGEQSKPGFFLYVRERLEGFERRPQMKRPFFPAEVNAFPEYYAEYFKQAMIGRACAGFRRRRCAFTPATASTRARASTRRRCRTSSATCSR